MFLPSPVVVSVEWAHSGARSSALEGLAELDLVHALVALDHRHVGLPPTELTQRLQRDGHLGLPLPNFRRYILESVLHVLISGGQIPFPTKNIFP